jgi:hypothetical protein
MPERMGGLQGLHCEVRLVEPADHWCGRIAQLVEQLTLNQRAQGSSPCAPTNDFKGLRVKRLLEQSMKPDPRAGAD